ncbi:unnamed protein product [Linum trigynum]|uniref:UEV domain-containing protein n=1 Tax=Linum trigynum TaxID=586398 RepID=A0AAV2CKV2_9ROSI
MAPEESKYKAQFIETALDCSSAEHALSYPHPKQRWLIRKHLRSLLADYPSFSPSTDSFTHDDGTTVRLLRAVGDLRFPVGAVPLAIWLPENYPYAPPLVFVSVNPTSPRIHRAHPFVDPSSGLTAAAYLHNWAFPGCNLTGLVRSLAHIFALDHPFADCNFSVAGQIKALQPDMASRNEAMDRLAGMLHYDLAALTAETETETESLQIKREELRDREDIIASLVIGLEHECRSLTDNVTELKKQAEELEGWLMRLRASGSPGTCNDDGGGFEAADEESEMVIQNLAADRAVEDVVCELGKAIEEEGEPVSVGAYMRQVRALSREQFWHRDAVLRLRGPAMLDY